MRETMDALRERLGRMRDVHAAVELMSWDQQTYMPPKAAASRGEQIATLSALAHQLATSSELGGLLERLDGARNGISEDDQTLLDIALYDYARATRLPESFVETFARATSVAYEAWVQAREQSDYSVFKPHLERLVGLLREKAEFMGYEGCPYNALLEDYERGMTAEQVQVIFADLAPRQSALIDQIAAKPAPNCAWLKRRWPEQAQWAFSMDVLRVMRFDLEAGRQDRSVHPFTTSFDIQDVRLTTRLSERDLFSGVMGTIHEGGHGLYEQGHAAEDRRTPLAEGTSLGMHESQSRMWENMIGRSLPFWRHFAPVLSKHFDDWPSGVDADAIYQGLNQVRPSFIRVEADECTYNLHIILRFELEMALLDGTLKVDDVPDAWNAKMEQYLGVDVPNDAHGCLQDIHWAHGLLGYFPTYALGNLYAAQLFEAMMQAIPNLWADVESGEFDHILTWLRTNIHRFGRRKTAPEILSDITGQDLSAEPYLAYLTEKYGALYDL